MADHDPPTRLRGDEADLFRHFNDELMRAIERSVVHDAAETVEEACAFAWAQFLQHQPDREQNWQGWLFLTAQRHAWMLERHARRRAVSELELESGDVAETVAAIDEIELRQDILDALSIVSQLEPRLQRVALLRALGFKHKEIGELTGDSPVRVDRLIARANDEIREILIERAYAEHRPSPRAERLWELEHEPPKWLVDKIGFPVRPSHRVAVEGRRRAWRRAALALDDYRRAAALGELAGLTGQPPADPALWAPHAKAMRALEEHDAERNREHTRGRRRDAGDR